MLAFGNNQTYSIINLKNTKNSLLQKLIRISSKSESLSFSKHPRSFHCDVGDGAMVDFAATLAMALIVVTIIIIFYLCW